MYFSNFLSLFMTAVSASVEFLSMSLVIFFHQQGIQSIDRKRLVFVGDVQECFFTSSCVFSQCLPWGRSAGGLCTPRVEVRGSRELNDQAGGLRFGGKIYDVPSGLFRCLIKRGKDRANLARSLSAQIYHATMTTVRRHCD